MNSIQEDLNDLDRMIDGDAAKDAIRSQVRLIAREVAALEADYASLAQAHTQLQDAHSKLQAATGEQERRFYDEIARQASDEYSSDNYARGDNA
jgi:prefoldin subunit 5